MHVHFFLPKMSALDKVSNLIGSLSTPKCNPAKKGKVFPVVEPHFPLSLTPWRFGAAVRCWRAHVSLREQPVAMRDRHYRSTIYENKAICACFGACRLPTNGAVFTIPALSAFTFAIFTGPVLNAAGVAHALVTSCACPALFTAAGSPDADAVSATVY